MKEKIISWTWLKSKTSAKALLKEWKNKTQTGKYTWYCLVDKEFLTNIYKELWKFNDKETTQLKKKKSVRSEQTFQ